MTDTFTTAFIAFLGLTTVILSLVVARDFFKRRRSLSPDSRKLTNAIAWQLLGESILGLGTLAFAVSAHFGWLEHWSINVQSALRFTMFAASSLTTIHLWMTVQRIHARS